MIDPMRFRVRDIRRSQAVYAAALAPQGLPAHHRPHDHGAFVIDPDGKNVEAVCHAPA